MHTTYLSKKGFKELHRAISRLETTTTTLRLELKEIGRAKSRDDTLHRNEVITSLEHAESQLHEKRLTLKTARPLPRKRDRLKVAIGSVVDLIDWQGRRLRYTIVDSLEANPSDGRISINSPLGQSLLSQSAGRTISWRIGQHVRRAQLVRIH